MGVGRFGCLICSSPACASAVATVAALFGAPVWGSPQFLEESIHLLASTYLLCVWCALPSPLCCLQVSKVLVTYGKHVLSVQQVADQYNDKLKGIWVCLQVRTRNFISRVGWGDSFLGGGGVRGPFDRCLATWRFNACAGGWCLCICWSICACQP